MRLIVSLTFAWDQPSNLRRWQVLTDMIQSSQHGATYKARMTEGSKIGASITFYPGTRCLGLSYGAISLSGHPMDSLHAANSDAAKEAIRYMENTEHKILLSKATRLCDELCRMKTLEMCRQYVRTLSKAMGLCD